jgi:phage repressor protein C with HTH and peptisase S24 domain
MANILTIKERILTFIEYLGIKKSDFFNSTGIQASNFKGKNIFSQPGGEMIVKILTEYPQLSSDWLLLGEGDMLRKEKENPTPNNPNSQNVTTIEVKKTTTLENNLAPYPVASEERPTAIRTTIEDPRGIPLIPFSAQAGSFVGERTAMLYDCERYVVPAFNGADFLMTVNGKSMTPSLQSGDIVACQRVGLDNLFFQWGKIYVLDTDQGALVKRIRRGSTPEHISIVSDNPEFDTYDLPLEHIHAVALVIGLIRTE